MKYSKKISGFSILEIIIFLFVISIISVFVVVGYKAFNNKMERQSINELISNLNLAKKLAISKNKSVVIKQNKDKKNDSLNFYIGYSNKYKNLKLYKSLRITSFSKITFNPSGVPAKGLSIYIRNKKNKLYNITILPATGKVNLYIDNKQVK